MEMLSSSDPLNVLAYQYDIVCNGIELSSGAIRNHRPDIMKKAFEIAGYNEETIKSNLAPYLKLFITEFRRMEGVHLALIESSCFSVIMKI